MITKEQVKAAITALAVANEEGAITPAYLGDVLDKIQQYVDANGTSFVKSFETITSISELPASPTDAQKTVAYVLGVKCYVYVGENGDTADGKYQSVGFGTPTVAQVTEAVDDYMEEHPIEAVDAENVGYTEGEETTDGDTVADKLTSLSDMFTGIGKESWSDTQNTKPKSTGIDLDKGCTYKIALSSSESFVGAIGLYYTEDGTKFTNVNSDGSGYTAAQLAAGITKEYSAVCDCELALRLFKSDDYGKVIKIVVTSLDDQSIPEKTVRIQKLENQIAVFETRIESDEKEIESNSEISKQFGVKYANYLFDKTIEKNSGAATMTINADGSINFNLASGAGADWYCGCNFTSDTPFINGHSYYVALKGIITKNTLTEGSTTSAGNNYFDFIPKDATSNTIMGTSSTKVPLVTGSTGSMKAQIDITNSTYTSAQRLYIQFGGKFSSQDELDFTISDMTLIDLTLYGLTWTEADELITKFGYLKTLASVSLADTASNAMHASVADSVESMSVGKDIEIWGDSLTAQGWGDVLATITGRTVYSHGYGGQYSTHIRGYFLDGVNKERTQIIFVGRNNFTDYETVCDDIRTMVEEFGKTNFIVMSPWNGAYAWDLKDGQLYENWSKIANRLSQEFPDNYINARTAIINGWDCGNVKLLSAFTQPSVGGEVTINVSDTAFLTTYNSVDEELLGEDVTKKIVIGINGKYDVYTVVSVTDSTHMVVSLDTANRIAVGGTVDNLTDSVTLTSGTYTATKYLRVMQNADYVEINTNDTTPATFRKDGVHMETTRDDKARLFLATLVARKLEAMKI